MMGFSCVAPGRLGPFCNGLLQRGKPLSSLIFGAVSQTFRVSRQTGFFRRERLHEGLAVRGGREAVLRATLPAACCTPLRHATPCCSLLWPRLKRTVPPKTLMTQGLLLKPTS